MALPNKEKFGVVEAAYYLGVHESTIRRWMEQGRIKWTRPGGGHIKITREAIIECDNWYESLKKDMQT